MPVAVYIPSDLGSRGRGQRLQRGGRGPCIAVFGLHHINQNSSIFRHNLSRSPIREEPTKPQALNTNLTINLPSSASVSGSNKKSNTTHSPFPQFAEVIKKCVVERGEVLEEDDGIVDAGTLMPIQEGLSMVDEVGGGGGVADEHLPPHDVDRLVLVADEGGHGAYRWLQELGAEEEQVGASAVADGKGAFNGDAKNDREAPLQGAGASAVADDKSGLPDAKNGDKKRGLPDASNNNAGRQLQGAGAAVEDKGGAALLVAGEQPPPQEVAAQAGEAAPDAHLLQPPMHGDEDADDADWPDWDAFDQDWDADNDKTAALQEEDEEPPVSIVAGETPPQHGPLLSFFVECDQAGRGEKPCTSCFEGSKPVPRSFSSGSMRPHYCTCHRKLMRSKDRVECSYCHNFFQNLADYYRHKKNIHGK
uniref:C2H2-type domain-containing protein n=1 Tax=Oryza glumipatula TaxID=40148 RepID=A0A0E0BL46_9ORYZ